MRTIWFLTCVAAVALLAGAAFGQSGYINNVPDLNQPPANPLGIVGFDTTNYCCPFAAANITEYWNAKGASGPANNVDGNPDPGGTSIAQYLGWWMDTNNDAAMNACPYRRNVLNNLAGTNTWDMAAGLVQFVEWTNACTFGCTPPPNLIAGKQGYRWKASVNLIGNGWNEIKAEIDAGRPLVVAWNYWKPINRYYNSNDGYSYYEWGGKDDPQDPEDPPENWNATREVGHMVTAVGYKQAYDPDDKGPGNNGPLKLADWVIVHDNWSSTDCDLAIPFSHQDGVTKVWMGNVTVDPFTAPPQGTLTVSLGQQDKGNHMGCIGGPNEMCQINCAADNSEDLAVNAITLNAFGNGNDQNDITCISIVKDVNSNGVARWWDNDKLLVRRLGGFPNDNRNVTIHLPGEDTGRVTKNTNANLIVVYSLKPPGVLAPGATYQVRVSAVYSSGLSTYTSAAVVGAPIMGGIMTSQVCVIGIDPSQQGLQMAKAQDDGLTINATITNPTMGPRVIGAGASFGNDIYIQDPEPGGTGIALEFTQPPPNVQLGQELVYFSGTMYTVNGERKLVNAQLIPGPPGPPIPPVTMNNKAVGAGDWFYDCIRGTGQMGVADAVGLNNIGTLVRATGRVVQISTIPPQPFWFRIDDGSGVFPKVMCPMSMPLPMMGSYVAVTGVCSSEMENGQLKRVIRMRNTGDKWPP